MFIYCGSCQRNFLYQRSFITHLLCVHYLEGPHFSCVLCRQQHSNMDELECHMEIHIGKESNALDIYDGNLDLSHSDGADMPPLPHTYITYQFDTESPESPPQPPTQQSPQLPPQTPTQQSP